LVIRSNRFIYLFIYSHSLSLFNFKRLFKAKTGKLNEEQFIRYYKLFRKDENVEKIAKHCFNAFDLDKNNYVDFGEFLISYVATTSTGKFKLK
jgi:Ca2+-binding EF-hand superfamily protein